ncbi:MAG: hypothetical protein KAS32_12550 [Candidatus Peribacteraceae bacterium]|nr:hypothetical protein [Candidatus Peribacteraceae bacterium]
MKIAFEFGLILSETAKGMNVVMVPEIALRAEEILINELKINGLQKTALNFTPLIMAIMEEATLLEEKKA